MRNLKTAHGVIAAAQEELARAGAECPGADEVRRLQPVGLLTQDVAVAHEAARRREQQPLVIGIDREQALVGLETEGDRLAHEVRILVGGVHSASAGDRIANDIDGRALDRAAGDREHDKHQTD